jgi:GTP-binding protein Era
MNDTSSAPVFRAGYVAIAGRPNVGKSTLTNRLVGHKVSIVSRKQQTTRHRVHGILTTDRAQFVFVDTPGFQTRHKRALNRLMNRTVTQALSEVDVIVFVIEACRFTGEDAQVMALLPENVPVVLVINKVDRLKDKKLLLPFIAEMTQRRSFAEIVPLSAEKDEHTDELLRALEPYLPEGEPIYDPDMITDRSERFLAAEYLREKVFRLVGDELPYGIAVEIERYEVEGNLRRIYAAVIVEREPHKAIVIGRGGERIKRIATEARQELENLLEARVYLEVWVKVRSGWADDEQALRSLGYDG